MRIGDTLVACATMVLAMTPSQAAAHFFVQSYTLPIPFATYAWAAAAVLLLSFALCGVFLSVPAPVANVAAAPTRSLSIPSSVTRLLGGFSLLLLTLCILTGLVGSQNPYQNFNVTFFWIYVVLALPYAVAVIGNFYPMINPWRVVVEGIEKLSRMPFGGVVKAPGRWATWLAFALYVAFICIELFAQPLPWGLSVALMSYTVLNVLGAFILGKARWFDECELFAVLLKFVSAMAWFRWTQGADHRGSFTYHVAWRGFFTGMKEVPARNVGAGLFIMFMLSSTGFDGVHGTLPWINVYWKQLNPLFMEWAGVTPRAAVFLSAQLYGAWQVAMLLVSPFLYWMVFLATVALSRRFGAIRIELRSLALIFAPSLIPIAFAYHLTHYYTILVAQGSQLVRLASDPFGWGWNLFGSASTQVRPMIVEMGTIWHTQVAFIIVGHVVSVIVAHHIALGISTSPRRAVLSQIPMLLLMVGFTILGLWILSLPLAPGGA